MSIEPRSCEQCQETYVPHRRDQRCCSRACITALSNSERTAKLVAKGQTKVCEKCGERFDVTDWYSVTKRRFCSIACGSQNAWDSGEHGRSVEKIERHCCVCGVKMEINPSLANTRVTCSVKCRGQWQTQSGIISGPSAPMWAGGTSKWWTQKARERDDFTCQIEGCGHRDEGQTTHAHHIVPLAAGGGDDLLNLITLCNRHHRELEHKMLMLLMEKYPKAAAAIAKTLFPPVRDVPLEEIKPVGGGKGAYHKRWRADQFAAGKCVECGQPAVEGKTLCEAHRKANRERQDRYKQRKLGEQT